MKKSIRMVLALLAVFSLFAAACGSDATDVVETADPTAVEEATAEPTAEEAMEEPTAE